jgi:hypothetical protein
MISNRSLQLCPAVPSLRRALLAAMLLMPMAMGPASADDADTVTKEDLKLLQKELETQKQLLEQQQKAIQQQQSLISNQQNQLNFLKSQVGAADDPDTTPVTFNLGTGTFTTGNAGAGSGGVTKTQDTGDEPVGEAPPEAETDETRLATVLAEEGGVLSDRGELVVEPSLRFTHSTSNRAFATGVEIQDIVFIGLIEVDEADRDSVEAAMTFRYGITDRFEVETRIPYVFRSEQVTQTFVTQNQTFSDDNSGNNLGDVEVAAHYQITDAPVYTVANVRLYTPTGQGPFDVDLDNLGRPTELPTGSGFWGVQPSITAIVPSDPVVFFGTFGYTINIAEDIDETTFIRDTATALSIDTTIGEVDPGDSLNMSLGMGLSLNESTSFSIGIKYDYIFPTTQEFTSIDNVDPTNNIIGGKAKTDPLHAASFLVGWSYQITDMVGVNLNAEIGATDDANDFSVRLGVPVRFQVFDDE